MCTFGLKWFFFLIWLLTGLADTDIFRELGGERHEGPYNEEITLETPETRVHYYIFVLFLSLTLQL